MIGFIWRASISLPWQNQAAENRFKLTIYFLDSSLQRLNVGAHIGA
jgi:hypothetical protein